MDSNAQIRTGGHVLIDQLALHGADTVFGVPGESYLAALDGCTRTSAFASSSAGRRAAPATWPRPMAS